MSPRTGLWILLIKVGKKGGVGEVLEPRGIISHAIDLSWDVVDLVAVAVVALVGTGIVAEEGGSSV